MSKKLFKTLQTCSTSAHIDYLKGNLINIPVWSHNLDSDDDIVTCYKEVQLLKWVEDRYVAVAFDTYVPLSEVDDLVELITEINDSCGVELFSLNI